MAIQEMSATLVKRKSFRGLKQNEKSYTGVGTLKGGGENLELGIRKNTSPSGYLRKTDEGRRIVKTPTRILNRIRSKW